MEVVIILLFPFAAGLWFGLLPYMLLRYRGVDLFGHGIYVQIRRTDKCR